MLCCKHYIALLKLLVYSLTSKRPEPAGHSSSGKEKAAEKPKEDPKQYLGKLQKELPAEAMKEVSPSSDTLPMLIYIAETTALV